ncbi:hypothetical protein B0H10DRAFT_936098 [Mycena sp. CBHHK59/15]|nr:hypothetical protein B0H10DRAFT_936098 [Mycena sp. CBHHK59/15]
MPRMFEPSDAWKQTQVDRSNPAQSPKSSPVERQGMRDFRDHSLERPVRIHATSYVAHSDRYRPDQTGRGRRSKSYRRRRQTGSSYRPNSRLDDHYYEGPPRRASPDGSMSSSRSRRSWSASRSRSRSVSRSRSRSPAPLSRLKSSTVPVSRRSPDRRQRSSSRNTDRLGRRRAKSRSASRSSIASTHVSDHPPSRPISPVTVPTPDPYPNVAVNDSSGNGNDLKMSPSPPKSLALALNLGRDVRPSDLNLVPPDVQVEQNPSAMPSSPPPAQERSDVQKEVGNIEFGTSQESLPLWGVEPTIPSEPMLDLTLSSASPSLVDVPDPVSPPSQEKVLAVHPQIDYVFEDIPRMADAKSIADALRTVVMTRLLRDHQPREERVNPVLMENLSIARPPLDNNSVTQDKWIEEISAKRFNPKGDDPFLAAKTWLCARFERRQASLSAKTQRLQMEYQALHQRWQRHCAYLNEQAKPIETDNVPVSGRTTRRSAANLGDTVRSDLEMEQIIASLGYDEATDPNQLSARNLAVIPDMISVTGGAQYFFDDTNHLVENPIEYYAPYTGIHDWTEPEKELFLDKYAAFPKQFGPLLNSFRTKRRRNVSIIIICTRKS